MRPLIGLSRPTFDRDAVALSRCASVADIRTLARRRVPRSVFDYTDGAAGDESGLHLARRMFAEVEFVPRVLQDVSSVDLSTDLFGVDVSMPLVLGPTGFTRMMNYQGEPAVAAVAARERIPYGLSTLGTTSIEDLAQAQPSLDRWFQLYLMTDRGYGKELVDRAWSSGYRTMILTVDTPVAGRRHRDVRNGLTIPPKLTMRTLADMVIPSRRSPARKAQSPISSAECSTPRSRSTTSTGCAARGRGP